MSAHDAGMKELLKSFALDVDDIMETFAAIHGEALTRRLGAFLTLAQQQAMAESFLPAVLFAVFDGMSETLVDVLREGLTDGEKQALDDTLMVIQARAQRVTDAANARRKP